MYFASGSSPHTRGALRLRIPKPSKPGIIPAYAGSTSRRTAPRTRPRDHPRIRGEHSILYWAGWKFTGSSPHTRGARKVKIFNPACNGIIPAYAGSTWSRRSRPWPTRDHPRIRGEHFILGEPAKRRMGSSPHTRGALRLHLANNALQGIIPAYAGSTA